MRGFQTFKFKFRFILKVSRHRDASTRFAFSSPSMFGIVVDACRNLASLVVCRFAWTVPGSLGLPNLDPNPDSKSKISGRIVELQGLQTS